MEALQREIEELRGESQREEVMRLRASQTTLPPSPPPTFIVQRERKLRRFNGTTEPLLANWVEESRSCMAAQQLSGDVAANFLLSYLDGEARIEMRCQPSDVGKDAEGSRGRIRREGERDLVAAPIFLPPSVGRRGDRGVLPRFGRVGRSHLPPHAQYGHRG